MKSIKKTEPRRKEQTLRKNHQSKKTSHYILKMKLQYFALVLLLLGLFMTSEARKGGGKRAAKKRERQCTKLTTRCKEQTDLMDVSKKVKKCIFDGEIVSVEDYPVCIKKRSYCGTNVKYIHKGTCGQDCASISEACKNISTPENKTNNNKKGGRKGGHRGGMGGKKGGNKKVCDQDGNPLARKCDIFAKNCNAIAAGETDFNKLSKIQKCPVTEE